MVFVLDSRFSAKELNAVVHFCETETFHKKHELVYFFHFIKFQDVIFLGFVGISFVNDLVCGSLLLAHCTDPRSPFKGKPHNHSNSGVRTNPRDKCFICWLLLLGQKNPINYCFGVQQSPFITDNDGVTMFPKESFYL